MRRSSPSNVRATGAGIRGIAVLVAALIAAGCTPGWGPVFAGPGSASATRPARCRKVAHILVKQRDEAIRIRRQVLAGDEDTFAELARTKSIDTGTSDNGGVFDMCRGQTVPEFDRATFALGVGETSQPIHSAYGWSIIQVRADLDERD
jgi:hypothetical protein